MKRVFYKNNLKKYEAAIKIKDDQMLEIIESQCKNYEKED